MNFFDHKDLGNHLLQYCPQVVKHPVFFWFLFLFPHKFLSIRAMKAYRGCRGVPPLILNLSSVWKLVVNFTHRPLYPLERAPVPIEQLDGPQSWPGRFGIPFAPSLQ